MVTEAASPKDSGVVDLGDALRRSLEAQKRRPSAGKSTGRGRPSGKAAAKAKSSPKRKAG